VDDVVVLLGAPGSGKSTIGEHLGASGLRWREWEPVIIARWGTRDRFVASKGEALTWLHQEIRAWIEVGGRPAVLETTGLSDAPLLADLMGAGRALVVRLDVSEGEAMRRIAAREPGRHLSDDPEDSRRVWAAFQERVVPEVAVDLVIVSDVVSVDAAADAILEVLETR
jgi:shikimate kinase